MWKYHVLICSLFMMVGAFIGFSLPMYISGVTITPLDLVIALIVAVISIPIHVLIHEAGHLLFGKLSGYRFLSFRLFSYMWVMDGERIRFKRLTTPGIIGQCLMIPPPFKEGEAFPYRLYLAGGVLLNVLVSIGVVGLSLIFNIQSLSILIAATLGAFIACLNLIPISISDGATLKKCIKNHDMRWLLYVQLRVNAEMTQGKRYAELDPRFLNRPMSIDHDDPFQWFIKFLTYYIELDKGAYETAWIQLKDMWDQLDTKHFYHPSLKKEWLFYRLMTNQLDQLNVEQSFLTGKQLIDRRLQAWYQWKVEKNAKGALATCEKALQETIYHTNKGHFKVEAQFINELKADIAHTSQDKEEFIIS
ncbi:hypothetical protein EH196_17730 [Bacillus sp. C1-1]|nr:hypothetical protein EH196_17730 [Bacillus sp. C1-1]